MSSAKTGTEPETHNPSGALERLSHPFIFIGLSTGVRMHAIAEKLVKAVAAVFVLLFIVGVFAGVPSAFSTAFLGAAPDSPAAVLALVVAGWLAGSIYGHLPAVGHGSMRLVHVVATLGFAALVVWLRRDSLQSSQDLLVALPSLLVALAIWLLVVITPWLAVSDNRGQTQQPENPN
jgi:hypothetical protein